MSAPPGCVLDAPRSAAMLRWSLPVPLPMSPHAHPRIRRAVYDTPSIQEEAARWQDVLKKICWWVAAETNRTAALCMLCLLSMRVGRVHGRHSCHG